MKRIIISSLMMMMLASFNSCNNTTGKTDDPADSLCVSDTLVSVEGENEIELKIKKYETSKLFLYDFDRKHIYHENTVSVDWPAEGKGFDIKALQDSLLSQMQYYFETTDVRKFVDEYASNQTSECGLDWGMKEVKERLDDEENIEESEDEEEPIMQFDTQCTYEIRFCGIDKNSKLITFSIFSLDDVGCGLGSCIYYGYDYIVFDYVKNKIVTYADIFKSESAVIKELNKQRLNDFGEEWEEGEIEGLPNINSLPNSMYISDNRVYFVFSKYEISYGAAGCPEVGIDVTKCPQLLTDYGKKMFNIK